jgi:N-acetylmuramoyl-L-alanine amidase
MSQTHARSGNRLPAPKVVVKLRERPASPRVATAETGGPAESLWRSVQQRYPGTRVARLAEGIPPEQLGQMVQRANRTRRGGFQAPNLNTYYTLTLPGGTRAEDVKNLVTASRETVERAYVQQPVIPARVNPWDDRLFEGQGYIRGRRGNRRGIFANFAWGQTNGDGTGVRGVVIDEGFDTNHEDLAGRGITSIFGVNNGTDHGTCCLGVIAAEDNSRGIVGIAPRAGMRVASIWSSATEQNLFLAILLATAAISEGDVISMSLQTFTRHPVEVLEDVFLAIWIATGNGRIVCAAAGNGGHNLEQFQDSAGKFILKPGHADFRDSGAIMVGGATDTRPHDRITLASTGNVWGSNFGRRVDCFAWGQRVCTTSTSSPTHYTPTFDGTSAATPIVAGAAILTQALSRSSCRRSLTVDEMRSTLKHTRTSIRSRNPSTDLIGRMPNMNLIHTHFIRPSCRIRGVYGQPGGSLVFLDPGHGGDQPAGRSTAYGGRGAQGTFEKDVTLDLARRVQSHFGASATLSRDGDYNLSIRDRLAQARRYGAPAFISLHAHSGRSVAGPEIWVYGDRASGCCGDPFGMGLAEAIRSEIAAVDDRPVRIREGRLGILQPRFQGEGTAACLIEAGSLSHPDDERRLGDPSSLDRLSGAIARGVQRYLGAEQGLEAPRHAFAATAEDEASDPEDTERPPTTAHAYAYEEQMPPSDGDVPEDARFGGSRQHLNGVHHETYR